MLRQVLCTTCGGIGYASRRMRGSILIELFLWCCVLVPGILYSIWRQSTVARVCRRCGNATVIPVNSPTAQQTLKDRRMPDHEIQALVNSWRMSPAEILACCVLALVLVGVVGMMWNREANRSSTHTDSRAHDAAVLISKCGKPDRDYSKNENLGQTPPTRVIEYRKAHLKYTFVADGNSSAPSKWELSGVTDTRTNKAVGTGDLKELLFNRQPCALGN
jgi:hypothetical protein